MSSVSTVAPRTRPKTPSDPTGIGTRERILAATEELIALHGFDGVSLKEIARQVGIRSPSIFAHFNGMEALMSAMHERLIGRIIMSWRPFDAAHPPDKRLRRGVRGLVAHFAENPATVRLMLRGMSGPTKVGAERQRIDAMRAMIAHPIAELFAVGIKAGKFRRIRTEAFMAQMLGAIFVSLVFVGWDEHGRLKPSVSLSRLQREAEILAMSIAGARTDARKKNRSSSSDVSV